MANLCRDEIVKVLSSKIRFAAVNTTTDNLQAFCPFHKSGNEKTPSLYIYVGPTVNSRKHTGAAFCQACGRGWSFSGLLRKLNVHREYIDAVLELAEEERKASGDFFTDLSFELPRLPEAVLGKYDWTPMELLSEGFSREVVTDFGIGFDKSSRRITFPLRDHHGRLVGVSGRTVIDEYPRYKIYRSEFNSIVPGYAPNKKGLLWGIDRFYTTAMTIGEPADDSPIIVCEGFKAAMWVVQAGFNKAVALLGASCSKEQMVLMSRASNEVVLFLDNDRAGVQGTSRAVDMLRDAVDVTVAKYPKWASGKSPDDLPTNEVRTSIQQSLSRTEWRKEHYV